MFLHSREMPTFWEKRGKERRQFLLSRIAIKDAVRVWWSRQHGTELPHPAEFAVESDPQGRPYLLRSDDPLLPHISITQSAAGAVAIVAGVPLDREGMTIPCGAQSAG